MGFHYNAFISYRHAELDSKVASEVQRQLERFHIPKSIQKSTGIQRISRVFRDKEELTISSDLNTMIEDALIHSDYLIVICSPNTKESQWVQHEIEFFLKTHSRQQIMTVLADGEPGDVVPKILLEQEATVVRADGTEETVMVPADPLSCDYRMPTRKARREELTRLAAAILGCKYDDLRQRQRRYRMRQLTAFASAAMVALTGLAIYFAWSASQIQKNYEQSVMNYNQAVANYNMALENQSEYLASESLSLLESGDRFSAMLLALEALPSAGSERPLVSKAEFALSQAAYAYKAPGSGRYSLVQAFPHDGTVSSFCRNRGETHLIVAHSGSTVTVWELAAGTKAWEQTFPNTAYGPLVISVTPEDALVVLTEQKAICLDYRTGETLWEYETDAGILYSTIPMYCPSAPMMVFSTYDGLTVLDTQTGECLWEIPAPENEEIGTLHASCFSADGKYLVAADAPWIAAYSLEMDRWICMETDFTAVFDIMSLENGDVLISGDRDEDDTSVVLTDDFLGDRTVCYPDTLEVACLDLTENRIVWSQKVPYTQLNYTSFMERISYLSPAAVEPVDAVACTAANVIEILDLETGICLRRVEFTAPVVEACYSEDYIRCVLCDGQYSRVFYDSDYTITESPFYHELAYADIMDDSGNIFTCQNDASSVLLYQQNVYDEAWQIFDDAGGYANYVLHYEAGKYVLAICSENMICVDAAERKIAWKIPLEDELYTYTILGADENYFYLRTRDPETRSRRIQRFSVIDGKAETLDFSGLDRFDPSQLQNKTFYELSYGEIVSYDLETASVKRVPLPEGVDFCKSLFPDPQNRQLLASLQNPESVSTGYLYLYTEGGEWRPLEIQTQDGGPIAAWSQDGSCLAVGSGEQIYLMDAQGTKLASIHIGGMSPNSFQFYEDLLLVLYRDGQLYRYDAQTGAFQGKTNAMTGAGDDITWAFTSTGKLVLMEKYGNCCGLETETWGLLFRAQNCCGFCAQEELLCVSGKVDGVKKQIGWFTLYSTDELIKKAQGLLGGTILTEEQKTQYGIG